MIIAEHMNVPAHAAAPGNAAYGFRQAGPQAVQPLSMMWAWPVI